VKFRSGRRELRAGRVRFTTSEIILLLPFGSSERAIVEGAMPKGLNPISLPRWLKDRLVDAKISGRALRSAPGREKSAQFWITGGS